MIMTLSLQLEKKFHCSMDQVLNFSLSLLQQLNPNVMELEVEQLFLAQQNCYQ